MYYRMSREIAKNKTPPYFPFVVESNAAISLSPALPTPLRSRAAFPPVRASCLTLLAAPPQVVRRSTRPPPAKAMPTATPWTPSAATPVPPTPSSSPPASAVATSATPPTATPTLFSTVLTCAPASTTRSSPPVARPLFPPPHNGDSPSSRSASLLPLNSPSACRAKRVSNCPSPDYS